MPIWSPSPWDSGDSPTREDELLQVVADAEHRAAHPVLDDAALTAALGTETARVLHSAHEAAAEIIANAESEADRTLTAAHEEIEENRARTESRLAEQTSTAESAAAELLERTNQRVETELDRARNEAEGLLAQARQQCQAMVDEAQGLRTRVLADLSRRRKVLHAQIEQLRAGRERLAETVQDVRRSIDTIAEELFAAEDNARLAAEEAGRQAAGRPDEGTPEEVAALLLAEEAEAAERAEMVDNAATVQTGADATSTDEVPAVPSDQGPTEAGGVGDSIGGVVAVEDTSGEKSDGESPVDALFAKIRAAHEEEADTQPASPVSEEPDHGPGSPDPPGPEVEADPDGAAGQERAGDEDDQDGPPEDRNPFAVRRDELIAPIVTSLARRLKRTLQDSQNELLDSLRSKGSHWSIGLLPDEKEHIDGYATAALPALEQASAAGVAFSADGPAHGAPDRRAGRDRPRSGRGGGRSTSPPALGRRARSGRRRRRSGGRTCRVHVQRVEGRANRAAGR